MLIGKIAHKLNTTVAGGALLIAFFSIVSKLLGFFRDRLLASAFGASRITDIYFASFKLPDLIFNILVLGALTSSFIPIFQKVYFKDHREGIALSNSILNVLLIAVGILTLLLVWQAPAVVPLLVPGFSSADIRETVMLTRILSISLLFFTASNVLSGILNAWQKFFSFALSSVVYNVGIIIGIIVLYPLFGLPGLAIGAVIGSILHFLVQLIEAVRHGWRYQGILSIDRNAIKIFLLMIPRTIGLVGNQVDVFVTTFLASGLSAGSLAVFNYANNLQSFPIGIFGVSLAVAAFPAFSKSIAENNRQEFRHVFSTQFRRILFFLIPISFSLLLLRAQIVRVILGTGSFDWSATRLTAQILGYFSLSIVAQGLIPLLARSFYALEDTRTPMMISILCIAIDTILSILWIKPFGIIGIAFSFSITNVLNLILLLVFLHRRVGDLDDTRILSSVVRITSVGLVGAAITYLSLQGFALILDTHTFLGIFMQGLISGVAGLSTYVFLSIVLRFEEVAVVKNYARRLFKPLFYARTK